MPTELEELVDFLHHGNTQIRQIAAENLVSYSTNDPSIFKSGQLKPVQDLKLLIKDYAPIAKNALIILVNISQDQAVLQNIAKDDVFLESLLSRLTNAKEPNANEIAMLLANMAKSDSIERILTLKRDAPISLSQSSIAIDQLMDCFVKGSNGGYNPKANFDYLSYLFADLAKFPRTQTYLTTLRPYDSLYPLTKLFPFTTHASLTRRLGVSSTIKNTCFSLPSHPALLSTSVDILPYILLPIAGPEEYTEEENEHLIDELQYLGSDKKREEDVGVLKTYVETLILLTGTRDGREYLRSKGVYLVIRECHANVEDEGVREECERLVQVLMRDEEGEEGEAPMLQERGGGSGAGGAGDVGGMVTQAEEEDEDERVTEIF